MQEGCPIPLSDILWFTHSYPIAKAWCSYYTSRMQVFTQIMSIRRHFYLVVAIKLINEYVNIMAIINAEEEIH